MRANKESSFARGVRFTDFCVPEADLADGCEGRGGDGAPPIAEFDLVAIRQTEHADGMEGVRIVQGADTPGEGELRNEEARSPAGGLGGPLTNAPKRVRLRGGYGTITGPSRGQYVDSGMNQGFVLYKGRYLLERWGISSRKAGLWAYLACEDDPGPKMAKWVSLKKTPGLSGWAVQHAMNANHPVTVCMQNSPSTVWLRPRCSSTANIYRQIIRIERERRYCCFL